MRHVLSMLSFEALFCPTFSGNKTGMTSFNIEHQILVDSQERSYILVRDGDKCPYKIPCLILSEVTVKT